MVSHGSGWRHVIFYCEFDQFSIAVYPQRLHNAVFVKGDSSGRQSQNVSYFFHQPPLGQELQDFNLAWSEFLVRGLGIRGAYECLFHCVLDKWCHIFTAAQDFVNCLEQLGTGGTLQQVRCCSAT